MPAFYQRQQVLVEALKDKLNNLLENDSDTAFIKVNSVDELEGKLYKLVNPYRNLPEINFHNINLSTSADGWKYAKRKNTKRK